MLAAPGARRRAAASADAAAVHARRRATDRADADRRGRRRRHPGRARRRRQGRPLRRARSRRSATSSTSRSATTRPGVKDDGNVEVADVDPSRDRRAHRAPLARPARRGGRAESVVARDLLDAERSEVRRAVAHEARRRRAGLGVRVRSGRDRRRRRHGHRLLRRGRLHEGHRPRGHRVRRRLQLRRQERRSPRTTRATARTSPGTIAQTTNNGVGVAGLAHCAKLMPVKVLSARGWGTMADVAEGIRWAADHGAQVINLSLGASAKSKVVENAVTHALQEGRRRRRGRRQLRHARSAVPAAYPGVIAVSATDKNDSDRVVLVARPRGRHRRAGRRRHAADDLRGRQEQVRAVGRLQRHEHGLAARRGRRGAPRRPGRHRSRQREGDPPVDRHAEGGQEPLRRRHPRGRQGRDAHALGARRRSARRARSRSRSSSSAASRQKGGKVEKGARQGRRRALRERRSPSVPPAARHPGAPRRRCAGSPSSR